MDMDMDMDMKSHEMQWTGEVGVRCKHTRTAQKIINREPGCLRCVALRVCLLLEVPTLPSAAGQLPGLGLSMGCYYCCGRLYSVASLPLAIATATADGKTVLAPRRPFFL